MLYGLSLPKLSILFSFWGFRKTVLSSLHYRGSQGEKNAGRTETSDTTADNLERLHGGIRGTNIAERRGGAAFLVGSHRKVWPHRSGTGRRCFRRGEATIRRATVRERHATVRG